MESFDLNKNTEELYNYNHKTKNISNNKDNEINLIIKINEIDVNKDIYFLDNIDEEEKKKTEHDKLNEMNESNTDLYINGIKYEFKT